VFEAVFEERQPVARGGESSRWTQSAVSHALSRLRTVLPRRAVRPGGARRPPDPRAESIYAKVRGALGSVRESVAERRGFDPATSRRKLFVGVSHPLGPLIAIRLHQRLAEIAPRVEVALQHPVAPHRARTLRCAKGASTPRSTGSCPSADRFAT
jgi:DNA-binding transcriptional LysR family regulator